MTSDDYKVFHSQNPLTVDDFTDDDAANAELYASHHAGNMFVLIRSLGDGWYVKMHDSWGEPENEVVVHVYDPDGDEQANFERYFVSGHDAFGVFLDEAEITKIRRAVQPPKQGDERIMLVAVSLDAKALDEADMTISQIGDSFAGKFDPDTIYDNDGNPIRGRFLGVTDVTDSLDVLVMSLDVGLEGAEEHGGFTKMQVDDAYITKQILEHDVLKPLQAREAAKHDQHYMTLGELRRKTAHLPDDMPVTAGGIGDKTEEWLNVELPDVPKAYDPSGETSDAMSLVLELREDFDTRQW